MTVEIDQRIEYGIRMLLDGHRKEFIKKFFYTNYGVKARQVERYLRLACVRLGRCTLTDVDELRAVQYARLTELLPEGGHVYRWNGKVFQFRPAVQLRDAPRYAG